MSDEGPQGKGSRDRADALAPTMAGPFELGEAETISTPPQPDEPARSDAVAATATGADKVDVSAGPLDMARVGDRYRVRSELGAGGMGQVKLCRDNVVGRHVAMKTIHAHHSHQGDTLGRFLREARVQGQLEHPAIVPVYDLGTDESGAPYFTMKRLKGMTLRSVLRALRDGDTELVAGVTTHKLLSEFGQVCQAIDYAHTRGVVHRDLKPDNIMLGDFGEVYVLDWGIAKLAGADDEAPDDGSAPIDTGEGTAGQTAHGAVLGTPGYMAPEQIRGDVDAVDGRTDVYALGAILFEILTLERLHLGDSAEALLASTIAGADARASARAPDRDIAPELEAVCIRATATDPAERFARVRELYEAVEAYLAGDRDLARRRELAAEYSESAADLARRVLAGETDDSAARRDAIRRASRAIALDATNEQAAHVITQLMLTPPQKIPPEVQRSLERAQNKRAVLHVRRAALVYLSPLGAVPLGLWMGVKSWPWVIALLVTTLACSAIGLWATRNADLPRRMFLVALAANTLFLVVMSRTLGWFILVPAMATTSASAFLLHRHLQAAWLTIGASCAAVLVPFALELAGVFDTSYAFADGHLVVSSAMLHLEPLPMLVAMVCSAIALVVGTAALIRNHINDIADAERQVHLQAWQLRQVMPESADAPA